MQIDVIKVIGPKGQLIIFWVVIITTPNGANYCPMLLLLPIANKSNKFYSTQTMKAKERFLLFKDAFQRESVGLCGTFCMRGCCCLFNTTTILENGFFLLLILLNQKGRTKNWHCAEARGKVASCIIGELSHRVCLPLRDRRARKVHLKTFHICRSFLVN